MNTIDYEKLTEIIVKSQEEFSMIPDNFQGKIYIEFGTPQNPAIINRRFVFSVKARGNSSVKACGNSSVEAHGNSYVEALDNSQVKARGNSFVEARDNSHVVALDNSSVEAHGNSYVEASGNSSVVARGNSSVKACGNNFVEAHGNSYVEALDNSSVVACGNSYVKACGNSSVEAHGNTQVANCQLANARIEITGNARIVCNPETIEEYISFYDIKHDKKTGRFFKAVHRLNDGTYHSDFDSNFCYVIGETITERCDPNVEDDCSYGIHISHLARALRYGGNWENIAILELESDLDKIIVPVNGYGKVRTSEAKVIREIPLEECGVYGKILAKRLAQRRS